MVARMVEKPIDCRSQEVTLTQIFRGLAFLSLVDTDEVTALVKQTLKEELPELSCIVIQPMFGGVAWPAVWLGGWFHGVENMTLAMDGRVRWRGIVIEQLDFPWGFSREAGEYVECLAQRCLEIERYGFPVTMEMVLLQPYKDWL